MLLYLEVATRDERKRHLPSYRHDGICMITTSLFFSAHYYYLRKKGVGKNGALMEPQIRTKKSSNEYQIEMSMLT